MPAILYLKVILSQDLLADFRTIVDEIPPGRIVVRRTDGLDEDPTIFDLTDPHNPIQLPGLGAPEIVIEYVPVAEDAT